MIVVIRRVMIFSFLILLLFPVSVFADDATEEPSDSDSFFTQLYELIAGTFETVDKTTKFIDEIEFSSNPVVTYIGYARYVMGDTNYVGLCTLIYIGAGLSVWSFSLRAIGLIRNLFPF